jgi:hypothetical protein
MAAFVSADPDEDDVDAPSREELLKRAAQRSSARLTWESIILPSDPILGEKMQPRVAERRARFRKVIGVCAALCVIATGATVLATNNPIQAGSETMAATKTAPATGVVTVEKLDQPLRTKAHAGALAARAAVPKVFSNKRR